jgi:hypothetical protein
MMDDLIKRQVAYDALMRSVDAVGVLDSEDIKAVFAMLPSAQPEHRWIPYSERMPEEETDILVTYIDGEETRIIPVNYGRDKWFDCIFNRALDSFKVIAWMPLPEVYREGAQE